MSLTLQRSGIQERTNDKQMEWASLSLEEAKRLHEEETRKRGK